MVTNAPILQIVKINLDGVMRKIFLQNAVAAIITNDKGNYLMQFRDNNPKVLFPGHWSFFGGAIENDESQIAALKRELREEIEFSPRKITKYIKFIFDLKPMKFGKLLRSYFLVNMSKDEFSSCRQHEGQSMKFLSYSEIGREKNIAPYDKYVVWLHHHQNRFYT